MVKGHFELPYATTMQPQSGQRSSFQWLPNNWQIGHGDLYMTELLGRIPTIPIPIFNGKQKFRLASSSIQVFIQMIAPMGLTLSVKVKLTKSTNS